MAALPSRRAAPAPDREPRPDPRGRARRSTRVSTRSPARPAPGKTILSNAIGLLLGRAADATAIGAAGGEAYVEAEFDLPEPRGARGARRAPARGRRGARRRARGSSPTVARAPTPGAGAPRGRTWPRRSRRLLAMSGQFEQRRLARPELPARRPRRVLRRHGHGAGSPARAWRELARGAPPVRGADDRDSAAAGAPRRAARRSSRTRTASSPGSTRRSAPSASGSGT